MSETNQQNFSYKNGLFSEMERCLEASTDSLHYNPDAPYEKALIVLHARVVDLCFSVFRELSSGYHSSAFIITRSALEALVDLRCLINDESYLENLQQSDLKQKKIFLTEVTENRDNPYAQGNHETHLKELSEVTELLSKLPKDLTIRKKFEMAEAIDWYKTVYNKLCIHSHNNFSVLKSRHLSKEGRIIFQKSADSSDHDFLGGTSLGLCAGSLEEVSTKLNISNREFVVQAIKIRERWRA